MTQRYSDHYRKNHLGKPHEYLISGINPLLQQKETPKNETAYLILYICLGVGVVFAFLIVFGFCRNKKMTKQFRKSVEEMEEKRKEDMKKKSSKTDKSTYTMGITTSTSTSPSMSTIPEEVQPQSNGLRYQPPPFHTTVTVDQNLNNEEEGRRDFGKFNNLRNNETPLKEAPPPLRSNLSRQESFPFEHFNMPMEEREPRTARVENMRPISDFLRFTPGISFMEADDEDEENDEISSTKTTSTKSSDT